MELFLIVEGPDIVRYGIVVVGTTVGFEIQIEIHLMIPGVLVDVQLDFIRVQVGQWQGRSFGSGSGVDQGSFWPRWKNFFSLRAVEIRSRCFTPEQTVTPNTVAVFLQQASTKLGHLDTLPEFVRHLTAADQQSRRPPLHFQRRFYVLRTIFQHLNYFIMGHILHRN